MKTVFSFFLIFFFSLSLFAGLKTGPFEYKDGEEILEGYLAVPKNMKSKNPAVLIVHDWMGPSDFTRNRAAELAKMGYVAFAVDIYGKSLRPKDGKEAGAAAGKFKSNIPLLRQRIALGLAELKKMKEVDSKKIVSMGYCFGGTTSLELARSGADIAGAASFHGGLSTPVSTDAKNIKAPLLIMHGAIDPYVPENEVLAFQKEMNDAKVEYEFISYSGAVHAFAVPKAGSDIKSGAAYDAKADKKSWVAFKNFLNMVAPL